MQASTTPPNGSAALPPQLALLLKELRGNPLFKALLQAYPATQLPPYKVRSERSPDRQAYDWAYQSGRFEGHRQVLVWLLGDDDRNTDQLTTG